MKRIRLLSDIENFRASMSRTEARNSRFLIELVCRTSGTMYAGDNFYGGDRFRRGLRSVKGVPRV